MFTGSSNRSSSRGGPYTPTDTGDVPARPAGAGAQSNRRPLRSSRPHKPNEHELKSMPRPAVTASTRTQDPGSSSMHHTTEIEGRDSTERSIPPQASSSKSPGGSTRHGPDASIASRAPNKGTRSRTDSDTDPQKTYSIVPGVDRTSKSSGRFPIFKEPTTGRIQPSSES